MFEGLTSLLGDPENLAALLFLVSTGSLVIGALVAVCLWICRRIGLSSILGVALPRPVRVALLFLMLCVGTLAMGLSLLGISYSMDAPGSFINQELSINRRALSGMGMLGLGIFGFMICYWLSGFYSTDRAH